MIIEAKLYYVVYRGVHRSVVYKNDHFIYDDPKHVGAPSENHRTVVGPFIDRYEAEEFIKDASEDLQKYFERISTVDIHLGKYV